MRMSNYTKKMLGRRIKITLKCIGASIIVMYCGALFFVPGLMLLYFLLGAIIGGGVVDPSLAETLFKYVVTPLCVVFVLGCVGCACYSIGSDGKL